MMKALLLSLVRAYQYALRPLMGANCRFFPMSLKPTGVVAGGALGGG